MQIRSMLENFRKYDIEHSVEDLIKPRTFEMAASLPDVTLRGVRWLVTEQAVGDPLLGRPVLEVLGLNTRNILAAAAEKYSGTVDVAALLDETDAAAQVSKVSRILEGVFHADGGADDADLDENDGWLDLGPEDPIEKRKILNEKVEEARKNGLSDTGCETLKDLLIEFDDVVKLKLDAGKPADIEPLRVNLKPDAIPVRSKQRRYPPAKKEFMTNYVQQLLKLGFVKKTNAPAWVSAPLIVPKRPPAMYRSLQSISAADTGRLHSIRTANHYSHS